MCSVNCLNIFLIIIGCFICFNICTKPLQVGDNGYDLFVTFHFDMIFGQVIRYAFGLVIQIPGWLFYHTLTDKVRPISAWRLFSLQLLSCPASV